MRSLPTRGEGGAASRSRRSGRPSCCRRYHLAQSTGVDPSGRSRPPRLRGWDGPILTDSGGYKVMSCARYGWKTRGRSAPRDGRPDDEAMTRSPSRRGWGVGRRESSTKMEGARRRRPSRAPSRARRRGRARARGAHRPGGAVRHVQCGPRRESERESVAGSRRSASTATRSADSASGSAPTRGGAAATVALLPGSGAYLMGRHASRFDHSVHGI